MNMNFEPMVAGIFGGWEIVLLLGILLVVIAPISLAIGLVIYFNWRRDQAKPNVSPIASPPPPPPRLQTQVIPRQCP
jgi:hypothetical protein